MSIQRRGLTRASRLSSAVWNHYDVSRFGGERRRIKRGHERAQPSSGCEGKYFTGAANRSRTCFTRKTERRAI